VGKAAWISSVLLRARTQFTEDPACRGLFTTPRPQIMLAVGQRRRIRRLAHGNHRFAAFTYCHSTSFFSVSNYPAPPLKRRDGAGIET